MSETSKRMLELSDIAEKINVTIPSIHVYNGRARANRRKAEAENDPSYIRPSDLPAPTRYFGRTPVWDEKVINKWIANRPGPGNHLVPPVKGKD